MKKINIAELLKDCPSGMELDCTMYEDCKFLDVDINTINNSYLIRITTPCGIKYLDAYGRYNADDKAKCVIFPKGKTTWEGFVPPCKFKKGDIITDKLDGSICIFKKEGNEIGTVDYYCGVDSCDNFYINDPIYDPANYDGEEVYFGYIKNFRIATEEEKEKLFKAIKDNYCEWNPNINALEELIESNEEENIEESIWKTKFFEILKMLGGETDIDGNKITPPEDYLIDKITKVDNGMLVEFVKKKPQYPKTYCECCDILGYKASYDLNNITTHDCVYDYKLQMLYRVLICRDAYWKIAGDWKPDWSDCTKHKYTIHIHCDDYVFWQDVSHYRWLSFPTQEMRDAFFENFKDLIEACKELL